MISAYLESLGACQAFLKRLIFDCEWYNFSLTWFQSYMIHWGIEKFSQCWLFLLIHSVFFTLLELWPGLHFTNIFSITGHSSQSKLYLNMILHGFHWAHWTLSNHPKLLPDVSNQTYLWYPKSIVSYFFSVPHYTKPVILSTQSLIKCWGLKKKNTTIAFKVEILRLKPLKEKQQFLPKSHPSKI